MERFWAILIAIIISLVWRIFWGSVTNKIVDNKGYNENWFWWGFFFGVIAFVVALTKPELHNYVEKPTHLTMLSNESDYKYVTNNDNWICRRCKKVNTAYVGTCSCGNTKSENNKSSVATKTQEATVNSGNEDNGAVIAENVYKTAKTDNIQMVRQYKQLLDEGIISHEEYEKKRKELLEL